MDRAEGFAARTASTAHAPGTAENSWFRVPEVWLMIVLLTGMVIASLLLLATALRHSDQLRTPVAHSLASPLPPSTAARPSDDATP